MTLTEQEELFALTGSRELPDEPTGALATIERLADEASARWSLANVMLAQINRTDMSSYYTVRKLARECGRMQAKRAAYRLAARIVRSQGQ